MNSSGRKGTRFGLALLGAGILLASGAAAQQPTAQQSSDDALSRSLRMLTENPHSVTALMGAGMASLSGGDAQAALNFFTRAEELSPQDGRIKMWVGAALVQLEQPRPALRFYQEAATLGVPEAEFAGDRGLAYDMVGDQHHAQADYRLALRGGANAEVTRRLALSLAISGEREQALQMLEEQLLVRDHAAERTRAFVLALTGDAAGASQAVQTAMPGGQAEAMTPFLARLPSLSPADRALAVNFGHFPGSGPAVPPVYASRGPITSAGMPDDGRPALGSRTTAQPQTASDSSRRRPGSESAIAPVRNAANAGRTSVGGADPGRPEPAAGRTVASLAVRPTATRTEPKPKPPATTRHVETVTTRNVAPPPAAESGDRLADVAAALAALSDDTPRAGARSGTSSSTSRSATRAGANARQDRNAAASTKKTTPPPPREPSRVWVQIAGGANKDTLPREFARLKAKAPRLLGSRTAWTVPANATNRLLVGPFATTREAQAFVNELSKTDVAGFAWTSTAGQKVDRLPAK
jgi:Flp pilus assembly protein TadD